MISKALEEYIKNMYIIKSQNEEIRVTDVAEKMGVSKASVNKALKSLKEENLVDYETYGSINLTDSGENLAKKILEAYDIAYLFFKDVLNMPDKNSKDEAEHLKSALSDESLNYLAKYVHKTLNLSSLDCDYNINNARCRECVRRIINKD